LTRLKSFPCLKDDWAIFCRKDCGPIFGNGDLSLSKEPFNETNNCLSLENQSGYKIIQNSDDINMLTNKKGYAFTII
jgi:hypothetical protein